MTEFYNGINALIKNKEPRTAGRVAAGSYPPAAPAVPDVPN